ncbi:MAG: hypothetical protein GBAus27B_000511 [Mycoplasmataceae bacterium]|nr:MAG: hypothetical protein GBAus27B_000511 [Mycoplasmataceae bacterium]
MTTPKLSENRLTNLQFEAEQKIRQELFASTYLNEYSDSPHFRNVSLRQGLTKLLSTLDPAKKDRVLSRCRLFVTQWLISGQKTRKYQTETRRLEQYFGADAQSQQALKNFRYYNDLTNQGFQSFTNHFRQNSKFFSADIYRQWLACLELGFYTAPDYVVLGSAGLNYSDNHSPSPRLNQVESYLKQVYYCRGLVDVFSVLLTSYGRGDSEVMTNQDWQEFLTHTRIKLNNSFSSQRSQQLFREIFGSDNPTQPANAQVFQAYQQQALDKIALALLPEQQRNNQAQSGMNRDYVAEAQAEQAQREAERQQREQARDQQNQANEQIREQRGNIHPDFRNNTPLWEEWTNRNFTPDQVRDWINSGMKPTDAEFCAYLRDHKQETPENILNFGKPSQLREEFREWKKNPSPPVNRNNRNAGESVLLLLLAKLVSIIKL